MLDKLNCEEVYKRYKELKEGKPRKPVMNQMMKEFYQKDTPKLYKCIERQRDVEKGKLLMLLELRERGVISKEYFQKVREEL